MINKKLNVLILEDSLDDADHIRKYLQHSGMRLETNVVTDKKDFMKALRSASFDVILSDHALPQFSSTHALKIIREKKFNTPFILVTGTVSEEFAVNIIQMGADDYILKNDLSRLPSAIEKAIKKRKWANEKGVAEKKLHTIELCYRVLFEQASDGIFISDQDGKFVVVNSKAFKLAGYSRKELMDKRVKDIFYEDKQIQEPLRLDELLAGKVVIRELMLKHKNGSAIPVEISAGMLPNGFIQNIVRNITERKKQEEELKLSKVELHRLAAHLQTICEEEKGGIASEIHDQLGELLTAIKTDITWAEYKLGDSYQEVKKNLAEALRFTDETIKTVRRSGLELKPAILAILNDIGLAAALEWQCEEFESRSNIHCHFTTSARGLRVSKPLAIGLFRIHQETLSNIVRYSGATKVISTLHYKDNQIILIVTNNGDGYNLMTMVKDKI
jgi:two-component system sensor histidine kinase UhpB